MSIESIQGQLPADSMNGFKDFLKLHLVFFTKFDEVFSKPLSRLDRVENVMNTSIEM